MLTVAYKQTVEFFPVSFRELLSKLKFCLFWIICFNIAPPVNYTMDMCIDAYAKFIITKGDYKIGGFSSNTFEFHKIFEVIRNLSIVFLNKASTDRFDEACLLSVKSTGIYRLFNLLNGKRAHFIWI